MHNTHRTILIEMLNLELADKRSDMVNATKQYLILRNIIDLAKEAKTSDEARPMVKVFFKEVV